MAFIQCLFVVLLLSWAESFRVVFLFIFYELSQKTNFLINRFYEFYIFRFQRVWFLLLLVSYFFRLCLATFRCSIHTLILILFLSNHCWSWTCSFVYQRAIYVHCLLQYLLFYNFIKCNKIRFSLHISSNFFVWTIW